MYRKYKNDPRTLNLQLSNALRKVYGKDVKNIKEKVQQLLDNSSVQIEEEDLLEHIIEQVIETTKLIFLAKKCKSRSNNFFLITIDC